MTYCSPPKILSLIEVAASDFPGLCAELLTMVMAGFPGTVDRRNPADLASDQETVIVGLGSR
jgi:hypothetical protein